MPEFETTESDNGPHWTKQVWIGAAVLLVLAGGLRFLNLNSVDLWEDEVYTYIGSTNLLPDLIKWEGRRSGLHSPLPYLEAKVSRALFGKSNLGMRMPAVFYGTATVLLLYFVLGKTISFRAGFFAALLLALNPFAIEWARDARMYSQWLFGALLLIAYAQHVVHYARTHADGAINWRWWLLGMLMMLVHAWVIFGTTTIAALAAWLGVLSGVAILRRHAEGGRILIGGAIAGGVYLGSWALTGIATILNRMARPSAKSGGSVMDRLVPEAAHSMSDVAGYLPHVASVAVWALALAGLIVVFRRRPAFVGLVVLASLFSILTFPVIAKQHFFAARYIILMVLPLSLGVGYLLSCLWDYPSERPLVGRVVAVLMFGALAALWAPVTRAVISEPRIEYEKALSNVRNQIDEADAVLTYPEWYMDLDEWYDFKRKARSIYPPTDTIIFGDGSLPNQFDATFESVFGEGADPSNRPAATWVFIVEPYSDENGADRFRVLEPLFNAYGLTSGSIRDRLDQTGGGSKVVAFRLRQGAIDQVVAGGGRDVSVWR